MKKSIKLIKILFGIVFLLTIVAFYIWTKIFAITIILLIILDFFTFGFFKKFLKLFIPKNLNLFLSIAFSF